MKRLSFSAIFLLLNVIFFSSQLIAQTFIESENVQFNEVIKEKLKVDINQFIERIKDNPDYFKEVKKNFIVPVINESENRESQVSSDVSAESELSASINPLDSNNLIVAVMKQNQQGLFVPIYYSNNFGQSWKISNFAPLPADDNIFTIGGGDPVLIFDKKGKVHLTWISLSLKLNAQNTAIDSVLTGMHYATSTDGGATWYYDYYFSVSHSSGYSPGTLDITKMEFFDDKQWLAVDLDENSTNFNNVYISLSRFEMSNPNGANIISFTKPSKSDMFNKTFAEVSKGVGKAHQFSSNAVAKNGRLITTFYGRSNSNVNSVLFSYSDDAGLTFSTPTIVSDFKFVNSRLIESTTKDTIVGVDFQRVYPSIYCAADNNPQSKNYGNSYVVWSSYGLETVSQKGFNVYLARSTDGGETWEEPIELSKEPQGDDQDQFYPAITVNEEGVVIISWYEQGVGGIKNSTNYVVAFSFDGGKTFTEPIAANTVPTNFATVGTKNSKFGIGEYNQIIATKGYAIPVWSDGRSGDGNLNVYAAFIPLVDGGTSIEKIVNLGETALSATISPNPASEYLNVSIVNLANPVSQINIIDIKGYVMIKREISGDSFDLDINSLPAGVYFFEVINNGIRYVQKFTKK